jgi:two-component system, NtrC family, sensor kinase
MHLAVMNLKTKMTLAVSLLTAVLLAVTGLSARHYFVEQMKELVFSQQFNMVSAIADQTDDKLSAIRTELVAAAGTLNPATVSDPAGLRRFFSSRPDTFAMFDNGLYLFSPKGTLLFDNVSDPVLERENFSRLDYFRKTLATGSPQFSDPFLSQQSHRHPIIMVTAPVFDGRGGIAAVLAGSIDLTRDNFLSRLSSVRLGQHGYLYLYNNSRTMIAHPKKERVFTRDVPPGANLLYDRALTGFQGTGETVNSRGMRVISSFRRLKSTGWILASNFPEDEAYAPVYRAEQFMLVSLAVVFLLSFLVVWLCMAHLTAPLISFTRQIRRLLEKGHDGPSRISVSTRDEIGVLGDAFNSLLVELDTQKEELLKQLEFLQTVMDTTPVPVFYKDADGRYLGCNKAFEEFTGCSREFIIGKTVFDVAPRHLADAYYDADLDLMRRKGVQTYETRVAHADGLEREVLFYKTCFAGTDGTPGGLIGAMLDITERQRAECELEAQKEFAENLVLNSSVPTFVLDRQHRVIIWNHACEKLTGILAADVLGSNELWKVFYHSKHPVLAELVLDGRLDLLPQYYPTHHLSQLVPEGVHAETWYRDRGGNRHYLTMSAAPIRDRSGALVGSIETLEDITGKKQAQDAHDKTRRQLQLILDAAGEGIYGVDLQGRVTFINPAAAQMLGRSEQELLGREHHSLVHGSGACSGLAVSSGDPLVGDGQSHQGGGVFWRNDGTSFPIEYVSTPIREDGLLVGAVVVVKDITERTRTEEQLLKLSQAVVQSPVAIIITDPDGKIEYVNPKFTEMSGYDLHEVVGRNPRLLKSGRTPDEVYKKLWQTISSGQVWSGEIYNREKSGGTYWQHATISPIRNGAGSISHFMAFAEDMTERKRLEAQLRHAQKMEAVGQLAGGVAHDFNNILTVIMGFGELLQVGLQPGDPKLSQMSQILNAADRATHLTKSLLAFSRKQVMLLQQVELNELAQRHSRFLTRIIGEDVTLRTELSKERLPVMADSGQIEQVLMNLATNARDAMPCGGVLSIKTDAVLLGPEFYQQHGYGGAGHYARITVADDGIGMDAEIQDKIFEPFFTTKSPGRGTGLGLSIVYGIVQQHGGYITIASQLGFGTTFTIYLPLVDAQQESARATPTLMPRGGKETILVVEDDGAVRSLMHSVLTRFGYSVLLAESGEEALALFDSEGDAVGLALLDVILPNMNGQEVCQALRQRSPLLKVLFLSGYATEVIHDRGIRMQGVDILPKPARPLELAMKVRDMLDAA